MVCIGGDDTLSYAARLNRESFPVVAIPKTMDNDVMGTDYCIGFSTAVSRSVNLITELRTPVGSHERIGIVEVFGRYSGETALFTGYLASTDRTIISEVPFDMARLAELLVADKQGQPEPLRHAGHQRGGRGRGRRHDAERRGGRLRPPQARRHRRSRRAARSSD